MLPLVKSLKEFPAMPENAARNVTPGAGRPVAETTGYLRVNWRGADLAHHVVGIPPIDNYPCISYHLVANNSGR